MRICRNTCPFRTKTRRCKSVLPAGQARQDAAKPGFRIALPALTNRGANFRNQPKGGLERDNPQFRKGFPASREEIAEPAAPGRQKRRKRMVFSNRSYSACAQAKPLGFSGHDACQGSAASASRPHLSRASGPPRPQPLGQAAWSLFETGNPAFCGISPLVSAASSPEGPSQKLAAMQRPGRLRKRAAKSLQTPACV